MDEDRVLLHNSLVPFLGILAGRMEEEARADRFSNLVEVAASTDKVQLVAVHDLQKLLAHILSTLQTAALDEVFMTPWVTELVVLPALVHSQQGEVVALRLEKLGLLLVSLCLLFPWTVENVLHNTCHYYCLPTGCRNSMQSMYVLSGAYQKHCSVHC